MPVRLSLSLRRFNARAIWLALLPTLFSSACNLIRFSRSGVALWVSGLLPISLVRAKSLGVSPTSFASISSRVFSAAVTRNLNIKLRVAPPLSGVRVIPSVYCGGCFNLYERVKGEKLCVLPCKTVSCQKLVLWPQTTSCNLIETYTQTCYLSSHECQNI